MVHAVFGDAGLVPILLIVGFHNPFLITCTAIFVEIGRGQKGGARTSSGRRPPLWSETRWSSPFMIALGLAAIGYSLLDARRPFRRVVGNGGRTDGAFCSRGVAGKIPARRQARRKHGDRRFEAVRAPGLVWVLATMVVKIDPLWAAVATLAAAMPTGANVFIYSRGYGLYVARATSATLISQRNFDRHRRGPAGLAGAGLGSGHRCASERIYAKSRNSVSPKRARWASIRGCTASAKRLPPGVRRVRRFRHRPCL